MDIDLDPNNPLVRIRHSLSRQKDIYNESDNNSILKLSEPKTNNSIRNIPICLLWADFFENKKIESSLNPDSIYLLDSPCWTRTNDPAVNSRML